MLPAAPPPSLGKRLSSFHHFFARSLLPFCSLSAPIPFSQAAPLPSRFGVFCFRRSSSFVRRLGPLDSAPSLLPAGASSLVRLLPKAALLTRALTLCLLAVDRTVYRRSKWRLAEIASDIEDDQSYTRQEVLTEDDASSADSGPVRLSDGYRFRLYDFAMAGYVGCEADPRTWHAPTSAPLSTLWGEGSEETWAKAFTLAKSEREQKHHILRAPPVDFGRKGERARALGELYDHELGHRRRLASLPSERPVHLGKAFDDVEEASPRLFPSLGSRDPLPEKTLGKRHASADSPIVVPKKKNKPSLGSIDEILAPPRSRRAVKPKEPVPISPLGVSALVPDHPPRVNSRLEDELASVKRQLSDALAAESVSAREEKEKEIAFQAKRIDTLEKELLAMSAARGHQKRAFIGIRKKVRSDNPDMKWDTPEVWQAMDDYFLSLGTDNEPSDSDPYPLDEGDSSADDVEVDVEKVGEEGVGDNVDANAGAGEGGGDVVAVDGQGGASDGGTDGDSSSSDNHSSKSD
ncbi:unnamed protein product [Linum tenue]|uniref:Uncharacterized protein n=1 Tax=Linum tenue TaxID=586396 RepID=A0AAV0KRJ1_9ROSI|nr:unnamed protein product [Linum tenue]